MRIQKGFTFIEVMITIGLLGVVFVGVGTYVSSSLETWRIVKEQADIQNEIRKTMQTIQGSIREMKSSDNGSFAIETATATEFVYYANIDTDEDIERVRLFLENEQLQHGVIEPTGNPATYPSNTEVVSNIADFVLQDGNIFSYFDENYTGVEDPLIFPVTATDIHLIQIHFLIDKDTSAVPPPADMIFQVTPRNLKVYSNG